MKGQAAIEYLMTYGWALLVITIVLAILYMVLAPHISIQQCTFDNAGFVCNDPMPQVIKAPDGNIYLEIGIHNNLKDTITIDRAICTVKNVNDVSMGEGQAVNVKIYPGSRGDFYYSGGNAILCKDKNGLPLQLKPGQMFKGYLKIWYKGENDIDPKAHHTAYATVMVKVEQRES